MMSISTEITEQTLTDGSTVFGVLLTGDGGCVKFDCTSEKAADRLEDELRQSVDDFTAMDGASVIGAVSAMSEFSPGAAPPQESDFTALEIEPQAKINAAPKPFRDLANWLASKLDSDDWVAVEPLLIAAIPETTDGCGRINAERQRQLHRLGYTVDHDDEHVCGELREAAGAYLEAVEQPAFAATLWPFAEPFRPSVDQIENLERAGALIAAEIDRLLRARAAGSQA